MTDAEILDWLNEWCDGYAYTYATATHGAFFTLKCVDMDVIGEPGESLRDVVQTASVKWKEVNI